MASSSATLTETCAAGHVTESFAIPCMFGVAHRDLSEEDAAGQTLTPHTAAVSRPWTSTHAVRDSCHLMGNADTSSWSIGRASAIKHVALRCHESTATLTMHPANQPDPRYQAAREARTTSLSEAVRPVASPSAADGGQTGGTAACSAAPWRRPICHPITPDSRHRVSRMTEGLHIGACRPRPPSMEALGAAMALR